MESYSEYVSENSPNVFNKWISETNEYPYPEISYVTDTSFVANQKLHFYKTVITITEK
jgi:hypothetical protein